MYKPTSPAFLKNGEIQCQWTCHRSDNLNAWFFRQAIHTKVQDFACPPPSPSLLPCLPHPPLNLPPLLLP